MDVGSPERMAVHAVVRLNGSRSVLGSHGGVKPTAGVLPGPLPSFLPTAPPPSFLPTAPPPCFLPTAPPPSFLPTAPPLVCFAFLWTGLCSPLQGQATATASTCASTIQRSMSVAQLSAGGAAMLLTTKVRLMHAKGKHEVRDFYARTRFVEAPAIQATTRLVLN